MPIATDPAWKLEKDDHDCSFWKNPNDPWHGGTSNATTSYCGGVTNTDAGSSRDAG
jgi:hypothetical protein